MNKELFVSSTPHETKVGLVEDDLLAEVYLERENEYTLAGSIYKGRVTRVLPGMQSAFVDIGLERDAFLYVSDFMELAELMCLDALNRTESCGGHFRVESQTPEGEAKRDDANFSYTATWEWKGLGQAPTLHKEPLTFTYIPLSQRSYK